MLPWREKSTGPQSLKRGNRRMKDMITLCGDNCAYCPRYLAKSEEELRAVAELWYRVGWRDQKVPPEEIACSGCSSHKICTYGLVECIKKHNVKKCRECGNFPCDKILTMLNRPAKYREVCRAKCSAEEFLLLSKAFFEKDTNLQKEMPAAYLW